MTHAAADLIRQPARVLAAAICEGEVSSVEVTKAHLARIAEVDGQVHAFLQVTAEAALETAHLVDEKRGSGRKLGVLAGVPIAVKDVLTMRGYQLPAGPESSKAGDLPMTPRSWPACAPLTWSSWARPIWTNSPWAHQLSTPHTARPITHGTWIGFRVVQVVVRRRRWPHLKRRWLSGPTPVGRSANRRRSPARWASSQLMVVSPATA